MVMPLVKRVLLPPSKYVSLVILFQLVCDYPMVDASSAAVPPRSSTLSSFHRRHTNNIEQHTTNQPKRYRRRQSILSASCFDHHHHSTAHKTITSINRGGGSSSDSSHDTETTDDDEEDETFFKVETTEAASNNPILSALGRMTLQVIFGVKRAISAGIDAIAEGFEEEDEYVSLIEKVANVLTSMFLAAFRPPVQESDDGRGSGVSVVGAETMESSVSVRKRKGDLTKGEFGTYLSKSYNVPLPTEYDNDDEDVETPSTIVHGGTLTDALHLARSQGRLLVAFLPATKPIKKRAAASKATKIYDQVSIDSLLSHEVAAVAERNARKREEGASFVLWGAKYGSSEANVAMKKFKVNKKKSNGNSPVLLVAYPSRGVDPYGKQTLIPRLLAQHHCNPPPSPTTMAAWLNALRKRHVKQYAAMQHELLEMRQLQERTSGYKDSIRNDRDRGAKEEVERQRKEEEEQVEREREEGLVRRRKELLEGLPAEPEGNVREDGVVTIALRFMDGRTGQRRFNEDTSMDVVFDWVDAVFEMERECVILSLMSGQKSFSYAGEEGSTIKEAGLGKMTALRVTELETNEGEKEEEE